MYKSLRFAHQRGITMFESMIVVAMVAVLAALALPSFSGSINRSRDLTVADTLAAALSNARVEAIKRGTQVSITARDDNWSKGWIVSVTGGVELQNQAALTGVAVAETSNPAKTSLTINGRGMLSENAAFEVAAGDARRKIEISRAGHIRVSSEHQ